MENYVELPKDYIMNYEQLVYSVIKYNEMSDALTFGEKRKEVLVLLKKFYGLEISPMQFEREFGWNKVKISREINQGTLNLSLYKFPTVPFQFATWNCVSCTFMNSEFLKFCEMCNKEKPQNSVNKDAGKDKNVTNLSTECTDEKDLSISSKKPNLEELHSSNEIQKSLSNLKKLSSIKDGIELVSKKSSIDKVEIPVIKAEETTSNKKKRKCAADSDSEEDIYIMEKILDSRFDKSQGCELFLIKWQGWPTSASTWEPEKNMIEKSLLIEYRKQKNLIEQKLVKKSDAISPDILISETTEKKMKRNPIEIKDNKNFVDNEESARVLNVGKTGGAIKVNIPKLDQNTDKIADKVDLSLSCHQCHIKRPRSELTACSNENVAQICSKKYCLKCLEKYETNAPNVNIYPWSCPSCQGNCMCAKCSKKHVDLSSSINTASISSNVATKTASVIVPSKSEIPVFPEKLNISNSIVRSVNTVASKTDEMENSSLKFIPKIPKSVSNSLSLPLSMKPDIDLPTDTLLERSSRSEVKEIKIDTQVKSSVQQSDLLNINSTSLASSSISKPKIFGYVSAVVHDIKISNALKDDVNPSVFRPPAAKLEKTNKNILESNKIVAAKSDIISDSKHVKVPVPLVNSQNQNKMEAKFDASLNKSHSSGNLTKDIASIEPTSIPNSSSTPKIFGYVPSSNSISSSSLTAPKPILKSSVKISSTTKSSAKSLFEDEEEISIKTKQRANDIVQNAKPSPKYQALASASLENNLQGIHPARLSNIISAKPPEKPRELPLISKQKQIPLKRKSTEDGDASFKEWDAIKKSSKSGSVVEYSNAMIRQDNFYKTVLSWNVNELYSSSSIAPEFPYMNPINCINSSNDIIDIRLGNSVQVKFSSEREYVDFFEYLLFENLKAKTVTHVVDKLVSNKNSFLDGKVVHIGSRKGILYEVHVEVNANDCLSFGIQILGHLFVSVKDLLPHKNDQNKSSRGNSPNICDECHAFGFINLIDNDFKDSRKKILKIRFLAPNNLDSNSDMTHQLSRFQEIVTNRKDTFLKLIPMEHLSTSQREYIALYSLCSSTGRGASNELDRISSVMAQEILSPNGKFERSGEENSMVFKLTEPFRNDLMHSLNEFQLKALHASCQVVPNPFVLLQGPPGTGKTKVILKMINVIHLYLFNEHFNSLRSQYVAKLSSSLVSNSNAVVNKKVETIGNISQEKLMENLQKGNLNIKNVQSREFITAKKPRILVCAPSNGAVDEIIDRLLQQQGLIDGEMRNYFPDICRIGSKSQHLGHITLDRITEGYLSLTSEQISIQITAARKELKRLTKELEIHEKYDLENFGKLELEPMILENEVTTVVQLLESMDREKICIERMQILQEIDDGNMSFKFTKKDRISRSILNEANIVFCTLSGSGSKILNDLDRGFDRLIIDEAGQCIEPSVLIPLRLNVVSCILVGDPRQLPATTHLQGPTAALLERSLFERFEQCGHPVHVLRTQYRMHPEICLFPSRHFYKSFLIDSQIVSENCNATFHQEDNKFGPYYFFDVPGTEILYENDTSISNTLEAQFLAQHISDLLELIPDDQQSLLLQNVGIITPYKAQQKEILRTLNAKLGCLLAEKVQVDTVDAFQGREKDIIIMSCVRASKSTTLNMNTSTKSVVSSTSGIGFLADHRRLNVAITRAKLSFWIIGDSKALDRSLHFRSLIDDACMRNLYEYSGSDKSFGESRKKQAFNRISTIPKEVASTMEPKAEISELKIENRESNPRDPRSHKNKPPQDPRVDLKNS